MEIRDENQPMIVSKLKRRTTHEKDVERLILLVPEICHVTGLTQAMRSDFTVMKDVAVHTRLSPADRQQSLQRYLKRVDECPKAKAILSDWGLRLDINPVVLKGRVLDSEVLLFGSNFRERVNPSADFTRTATSKPMLKPVGLDNWVLVYIAKEEHIVKTYFGALKQEAQKMGMNITLPVLVKLDNDRPETYLKKMRENVTRDSQLIMTIVPAQRSDRYSAIKKFCLIENPVASQIVVTKTISDQGKLNAVAARIALQINCKIGGELWGASCPMKNLMIIGIDIYHDVKANSTGRNSIAGVVSSWNRSESVSSSP